MPVEHPAAAGRRAGPGAALPPAPGLKLVYLLLTLGPSRRLLPAPLSALQLCSSNQDYMTLFHNKVHFSEFDNKLLKDGDNVQSFGHLQGLALC